MYHPILRGKQFELIALRELAERIPPELIRPVIEPVRKNLAPLQKTIETLFQSGIKPIVIINPRIGDFFESKVETIRITERTESFIPCVKAKSISDLSLLSQCGYSLSDSAIFIDGGIDRAFVEKLGPAAVVLVNKDKIHPGALSLLQNVVLFGDFFARKNRNADYEEQSFYSSLHTQWKSYSNAIGFGDYTILSEEYNESGGPAYVVTVHLSYVNREEFDAMYVRHFSSFNDDSPTNPGGKFKSALEKIWLFSQENPEVFSQTQGLQEIFSLIGAPFPGLGQIKKYSIKHHIETTCDFCRSA